MPFDFPASPSLNQQVTGANGVVWIWDGVKWVASTAGNPFPVAPTPPVGDNDTSVATTAFVQAATATAQTNVGRNLIHNALFTVAQRGAGAWTTNGAYLADRWQQWFVGGSISTAINPASDTFRSQAGDEAMASLLYSTFTGTAGAGDVSLVQQNIEGVRRLGGKTVTVSFWAAGAGLKLGVSIDQNFGTGGSPSASVTGVGQAASLTGAFTRYSVTFTLPSAAGKTLGTNNNDTNVLNFYLSSGATFAVRAGSIGVQSGSIGIWGVQLEIGSVATPLEKRDIVLELQQCQRFYQVGTFHNAGYAASTGIGYTYFQPFPVPMRVTPTVTISSQTAVNITGQGFGPVSSGMSVTTQGAAIGGYIFQGTFTASADL